MPVHSRRKWSDEDSINLLKVKFCRPFSCDDAAVVCSIGPSQVLESKEMLNATCADPLTLLSVSAYVRSCRIERALSSTPAHA